ncbi:MAG: hypothetical protein JNM84_25000 [Planctomycetes bacterium]|nr:hypothetical protein [Planctomycetota bacterium]
MQLWNHAFPGIYIDATEAQSFFHRASRDLNSIASKPIGKSLLELISKRCRGIGTKVVGGQVVVKLGVGTIGGDASWEKTAAAPGDFDVIGRGGSASKVGGAATNFRLAGAGASCPVAYNPSAESQYNQVLGIPTPPYIALGHELIHALHSLSGDMYTDSNGDIDVMHEEARTCGIGPYSGQRISENALRKEHGLTPPRTYYSDPGDCDGLASITR